jgi:CRP/FNR family cyclic AMP-dependent transcriptional regulator
MKGTEPTHIPMTPAGRLLSAHRLFEGADPSAVEQLAQFTHIETAPKGKTLFRKGDEGSCLMIVVDGTVKIAVPAPDGQEVLLNVLRKGEMFGEIALLDGGARTADAVAQTDSLLLVLDRRDVVAFLHRNPSMALHFISVLCKTLRRASDHLEGVVFLELPVRLARAIQRLRHEHGDEIALTQRELGHMIGSSRESVNQALRAWRAKGWVELKKGSLIIRDPAAIERIEKGSVDV